MIEIVMATDHAGYFLKEIVKSHLKKKGFEVIDYGTNNTKSCDYPDYIIPACLKISKSKKPTRGIIFGGSGIGEAIAANKVKGIFCALVFDEYTAAKSREHNNTNVLSLGARTVTSNPDYACKLVDIWLSTQFSKETRHTRRIDKIRKFEKTNRYPPLKIKPKKS